MSNVTVSALCACSCSGRIWFLCEMRDEEQPRRIHASWKENVLWSVTEEHMMADVSDLIRSLIEAWLLISHDVSITE
jgi:hypothetical protein